jgi:hypothetical protein
MAVKRLGRPATCSASCGRDCRPDRRAARSPPGTAAGWSLIFTARGRETIPLPPFEALPLDLTLLWELPER